MSSPTFDSAAAHRHFSVFCFNAAWDLIEKAERSAEENEEMVQRAMASLWHWGRREDCGERQRSVGHWQVSRCLHLAGRAEEALRYAQGCLEWSRGLSPFYQAYAHEAAARAISGMGTGGSGVADHLQQAAALAEKVEDAGERAALEADLRTVPGWGA